MLRDGERSARTCHMDKIQQLNWEIPSSYYCCLSLGQKLTFTSKQVIVVSCTAGQIVFMSHEKSQATILIGATRNQNC